MKPKHTPEPWHIGYEGHVMGDLKLVAGCMGHQNNFTPNLREINAANAARIVACVNACAGLTDADLEALRATDGSNVQQVIDNALSVRQQRDELLAALQRLLNPNYDYALRDGQFWAMEAKSEARAAIARARGTV